MPEHRVAPLNRWGEGEGGCLVSAPAGQNGQLNLPKPPSSSPLTLSSSSFIITILILLITKHWSPS